MQAAVARHGPDSRRYTTDHDANYPHRADRYLRLARLCRDVLRGLGQGGVAQRGHFRRAICGGGFVHDAANFVCK